MKLQDINFRVWNYTKKEYEEYPALAKMGSVVPAKSHHIRAKPFLEYDESGDELEVEFWTGFKDKNLTKIYEGDILNHYSKELGKLDIRYMIKCGKEGGLYPTIVDSIYPIYTCSNLPHEVVYMYSEVVGNIHENPELLESLEN